MHDRQTENFENWEFLWLKPVKNTNLSRDSAQTTALERKYTEDSCCPTRGNTQQDLSLVVDRGVGDWGSCPEHQGGSTKEGRAKITRICMTKT